MALSIGRYVERIAAIHQEVLRSRLFVALHMHAGDGNVHTNIPVNSDHYEMLQTAYAVVGRIMALARALDGVVSGEHGIGITKLEFLTEDEIRPFRDYKARSTRKAVSTRASCCPAPTWQGLHARRSRCSAPSR
jgi:FAD/FMN-containing dehydrogenase